MARMRMVRPELFVHEDLFAAEQESKLPLRLAYIGLWTQCDRAGRFEWRPMRLKLAILPWDVVDFTAVLDALVKHGFVVRYDVAGRSYGCIPTWSKHQKCHPNEADSTIPPPTLDANGRHEDAIGCPRPTNVRASKPESESESESEKKQKFVRPSVEEVETYCRERGNGINAQHFVDYYEARGWKLGKQVMKDWRAAVRTWERNATERTNGTNGHANGKPFKQRVLTPEECAAYNRGEEVP